MNLNWTKAKEHCSTPRPLPSLHVILVPSGRVIKENGSELTLYCNLQTSLEPDMLQFAWEFNGTIHASPSSTLRIIVTERTEGEYRCSVSGGLEVGGDATPLITSVSNSIHIELPSKIRFFYM